jgi:hypothetical protein
MLQVQVLDAADPDADPLTFQFDWRVNGQTVRLHSSSTASDVLDLSQPGLGDRGDVIEVVVTASDGTASTSTMASLTVAPSPSELYADYQLAVSQANAAYLANVADRDAAILAARASAQADADELYANYESAVASAQAVYDAAIASAESDYRAALAAANALWELATADVRANYDAAMEAAQAAYDAAIAWLDADYEDAIAAADADYEAYIAPYQSARNAAYDAWQADPQNSQLQQEYNDAQAALDAAIVFASAQRAADYAAALATRQAGAQEANDDLIAALEAANANYASAIEEANADWNAAEETAWAIYLAAKKDADDAFSLAEATAWSAYTAGVAGIDAELATAEAEIESYYATLVSAALAAWHMDEDEAWTTYEVAMANVPGTPELGSRVRVPPAMERNGERDLGQRIFLVGARAMNRVHIPPVMAQFQRFRVDSVVITPPNGWNGRVGDNGTTFTVTISGVGHPNRNRITWSVWDQDAYFDDDKLQAERDVTLTYQGNTWTITRTFLLFANSSGSVSGIDGSSGESEAEIYVYVVAYEGPARFATRITASSATLTVRASDP